NSRCMWQYFGCHVVRRRLDRLLCHNGSRLHRRRLTLDNRLSQNRGLGHNRSLGYSGVVALPFASAKVERKTDHANENNWHIAVFNDPLRQQTAPSPCPPGSFPHSRLHRQEKCVESMSCGSRAPVLIYRPLSTVQSRDLFCQL